MTDDEHEQFREKMKAQWSEMCEALADDLNVPHRRYIAHEVGHVFGCYHSDGAVFGNDSISYMWNGGRGGCFDSGSPFSTERQYAACAEGIVNHTANRIS